MKISSQKLLNYCLNIYNRYKETIVFGYILLFFSKIFKALYKTRLYLYKKNIVKTIKLPAYVISVGNITSGGTGKTPITIEIAKYFINKNYKVAILSRGYQKTTNSRGVILVSDGVDILTDFEDCGDEPYLIAKKVPQALVLSGKNRVESAKAAIKLGAEVLILDDGFQYIKLSRNENILMLDSYNPFDNNHLLPRGKLRENLDSIKRATAIIMSNTDRNKPNENIVRTINHHAPNVPILKTGYRIKELVGINTKRIIPIENAKELNVLAISGIGNPISFIDLLKMNSINVISSIDFPDHYNYEYVDIVKMLNEAKKHKVEDIITTEKDSLKVEELCQAAPVNFWYTKLEVIYEPDFFENLLVNSKILEKIKKN